MIWKLNYLKLTCDLAILFKVTDMEFPNFPYKSNLDILAQKQTVMVWKSQIQKFIWSVTSFLLFKVTQGQK